MKRMIIAYNPRSSKHKRIEEEVIKPARELKGYTIGKFEIRKAPVDENAKNLAKILNDDDLLVVAGGDGSATMALNAVMMTPKKVALAVISYGNFNDMARMLGQKNIDEIVADFEAKRTQKLYPLEAVVDGKHFRYAGCYFTLGMFSESTEVFDTPKTRGTLKKGKKGLVYSVTTLARWYFRNHHREFLSADIQMNGVPMNKQKMKKNGKVNEYRGKHVTDVMFVNSKTVAKVMKGGDYWKDPKRYYVAFGRLKRLFRLAAFMMKSMVLHVPGHDVEQATRISFSKPVEIEIQAEGEYERLKLSELIVKKAEKSITVVV